MNYINTLRSETRRSPAAVLTGGKARSAPPLLRPPARPFASVAKEKRQSASDDLNIPQDPLSKFNLGLELANVTRCGGRYHAAANCIPEATKRGINKTHLGTYAKTVQQRSIFLLNRRGLTPF